MKELEYIANAQTEEEQSGRYWEVRFALADRALELATDPAVSQIDGITALGLYNRLAPPFERRVDDVRVALAHTYHKYGLAAEDFELVVFEDAEGVSRKALVLATPHGIDFGHANHKNNQKRMFTRITKDPEDTRFKVIVDGEVLDTRQLTRATYDALVRQKQAKGEELPDACSENAATQSWLFDPTGQVKTAPIAQTGAFGAQFTMSDKVRKDRGILFRPAVILA